MGDHDYQVHPDPSLYAPATPTPSPYYGASHTSHESNECSVATPPPFTPMGPTPKAPLDAHLLAFGHVGDAPLPYAPVSNTADPPIKLGAEGPDEPGHSFELFDPKIGLHAGIGADPTKPVPGDDPSGGLYANAQLDLWKGLSATGSVSGDPMAPALQALLQWKGSLGL